MAIRKMETMNTDLDIDREFAALEIRKAKLIKLTKLRKEVSELELVSLVGSSIPRDAVLVMKIVCEEVCLAFNMDLERLCRKSREDCIATPRQIVFYIGRELADVSLAGVGRIFHKDHGTVLHGCRKIKDRIETDNKFKELVGSVMSKCQTRLQNAN